MAATGPASSEKTVLERRRDEFSRNPDPRRGTPASRGARLVPPAGPVALLVRSRSLGPPAELGGALRRVLLGRRPPVLRPRGARLSARPPRRRRAAASIAPGRRLGDARRRSSDRPPDRGAARPPRLRPAASPRRRSRRRGLRRRRPRLLPRVRPERAGRDDLLASLLLIGLLLSTSLSLGEASARERSASPAGGGAFFSTGGAGRSRP